MTMAIGTFGTAGADRPEFVADPVSHISISGVHGGSELKERLAHPPEHLRDDQGRWRALALGAAFGALAMYLLKR